MAGTLLHAPRFEQSWYTGNDGQRHYELSPGGEDSEVISVSSWRQVVDYFRSRGVPPDAWPAYETDIDLPLSDLISKNERLRRCLADIVPDEECPEWGHIVWRLVRSGELLCYCTE